MLEEIETLLILQDKDLNIRKLREELNRLPGDIIKANARLEDDKKAVAALHDKVQENEVSIKNLELDAETRRDTIGKLKVQQYETKKNEEYRALGHEVVRYENEVSSLEDQELELMELAEELRAEYLAAKEKQARTQTLVDEELLQIQQRSDNSSNTIENLIAESVGLRTKIDEETLFRYDKLIKNKGDAAVVPLRDGICGGCHVRVISSTAVTVKGGKVLANCEQCGRILYFED